jgi:hypothetical protein
MLFLLFLVAFSSVNGLQLVQRSHTNLTYNFDITMPANFSWCTDVFEMTTFVGGVAPAVTVDAFQSSLIHKISDIQFTFLPARQYVGGVDGFATLGGTNLGRYPLSWDHTPTGCMETTIDTPTLEPFNQICIANTCSKGTCPDNNEFFGQLTVHGFRNNEQLFRDPNPARCGNPNNGEIQYIAHEKYQMTFQFQSQLEAGGSMCLEIDEAFTPKGASTPAVHLALTDYVTDETLGSADATLDNFALFFKYPDGSSVVFNADTTFGDSVSTLPDSWTGLSPDAGVCYSAFNYAPELAKGFTEVCVGNTCSGASCGISTFIGAATIKNLDSHSHIDWVGNINNICANTIYQPTFKPTQTPPLTQGDASAILIVIPVGLFMIILFGYLTITRIREIRKTLGFERLETDDEANKMGKFAFSNNA